MTDHLNNVLLYTMSYKYSHVPTVHVSTFPWYRGMGHTLWTEYVHVCSTYQYIPKDFRVVPWYSGMGQTLWTEYVHVCSTCQYIPKDSHVVPWYSGMGQTLWTQYMHGYSACQYIPTCSYCTVGWDRYSGQSTCMYIVHSHSRTEQTLKTEYIYMYTYTCIRGVRVPCGYQMVT